MTKPQFFFPLICPNYDSAFTWIWAKMTDIPTIISDCQRIKTNWYFILLGLCLVTMQLENNSFFQIYLRLILSNICLKVHSVSIDINPRKHNIQVLMYVNVTLAKNWCFKYLPIKTYRLAANQAKQNFCSTPLWELVWHLDQLTNTLDHQKSDVVVMGAWSNFFWEHLIRKVASILAENFKIENR